MDMIDIEIIIKLCLSALFGLLIGFERELKRKPIGIKTCLVMSTVSCLLTIISIESAYSFPANADVNITMDPLRLASQIVSGIGFLGAGVILHRSNESISGLTTAALIWGAASLGIAVGAGFYTAALTVVLIIIFGIQILPMILNRLGPKKLSEKEILLKITLFDQTEIQRVINSLEEEEIHIIHTRIKDMKNGSHLLELRVSVNHQKNSTNVYHIASNIAGVKGVETKSF
ncbi:MgtC/SapB family protein [Bacillus sp. 2205SS5-2]|uniref:MgtC/SapB family protein n=1 Tax=Bacillus sp. 2205SS5-2 TaxID=3109031 RepID=UPI0030052C20